MERRVLDGSDNPPQKIVYTCWPWSWALCGILTMFIGGALILQTFFPADPELVWGIVLIAAGALILLWGARGGDI